MLKNVVNWKRLGYAFAAVLGVLLATFLIIVFAAAVGPGWFFFTLFVVIFTTFFYRMVFKDIK